MPIFFYLPFILARGIVDVGAEAMRVTDVQPQPAVRRRRTQPGFDQPWLAAQHPERK